jgi:hypothetical protein
LVEVLDRRRHFTVGVGEGVGELRQVVVECDELLVALVQRVDEQGQTLDDTEEVAAALVQGGQRFGQVVQRRVDLLTLAGETVGERLDDVAERTLGLVLRRPQIGEDAVDRVAELVVLDRHLGAVLRNQRTVLHHRAAGVGRGQLDLTRRDQARVQDGRRGVRRNLVLGLVVERHPHLVAGRLDALDRPDPHAHDLDLVAGIQGQRLRELGHHGVVGQLLVQVVAQEGGDDHGDEHHRAHDQAGLGQRGQLHVSDVEDRRHLSCPLTL